MIDEFAYSGILLAQKIENISWFNLWVSYLF